MGDEEKKISYDYRILAAIDATINVGKDYVICRGWSPLVQLGTHLTEQDH
jgi:hypothetical protein